MALPANPSSQDGILKNALVPEHSIPLIEAVSRGKNFTVGPWLFYSGDNWLMGIGYPLGKIPGELDFESALKEAVKKSSPETCYIIGSTLPDFITPYVAERDHYYVLSTTTSIPSRLKNIAIRAGQTLNVELGNQFTADHRKLWTEFLASRGQNMSGRVRQLYLDTPKAILVNGMYFLDARDKQGNLTASMLIDFNPHNFAGYIIGAHSRLNYFPHAMDLLFYKLQEIAREKGKRFIHLGLGINPGIARFKKKWGAVQSMPYLYAEWQPKNETVSLGKTLGLALLKSVSARPRPVQSSPKKPFAMIWEVEKNGARSYLGGTAHFFCHSFEYSFRKLFKTIDNVIFEGPLDNEFMASVEAAGKILPPGDTPVYNLMSEEEIRKLERTVNGSDSRILKALNMAPAKTVDVRGLLKTARPWHVFFTLWTAFLERNGWTDSVDMEAWRIAGEMGKNVIGMETLDEQLASLGTLPVDRVVRFFRNCGSWKKYAALNKRAYLAGDLEKMMGSSAEFPTRTEHVIGKRDERFRQRMRPWLEKGGCAVFVGSAHLVNLRHMLQQDGFIVRQRPFGIIPKIQLKIRNSTHPDEQVTW